MNLNDLTEYKNKLGTIFRRNHVIKALLFGSVSSGKNTRRSDIDILILMESDKRFFDRYDDFNEVYDVLKGSAVDMLIYTPDELSRISNRVFIKNILSEGKIIYEH